jgi:hypothetical protein
MRCRRARVQPVISRHDVGGRLREARPGQRLFKGHRPAGQPFIAVGSGVGVWDGVGWIRHRLVEGDGVKVVALKDGGELVDAVRVQAARVEQDDEGGTPSEQLQRRLPVPGDDRRGVGEVLVPDPLRGGLVMMPDRFVIGIGEHPIRIFHGNGRDPVAVVSQPAFELAPVLQSLARLQIGMTEPVQGPPTRREQPPGDRLAPRDVGDIGVHRRLGQREVRVAVVPQIHPRVQPAAEQVHARRAILFEFPVDEAYGRKVVAPQAGEQRLGRRGPVGCGARQRESRQVVERERDVLRGRGASPQKPHRQQGAEQQAHSRKALSGVETG